MLLLRYPRSFYFEGALSLIQLMPRDQVVMAWQSVAKVLGVAPWPDVLTFLQVSILF
jgi:hypothetical protein